jgi:dihydropteroate synthase
MQSKIFSTNKTLNVSGRLIDLSIPKVMGILNVTPDSFYDGKRYTTPDQILKQAEKMVTEGADFIDVGGYSSRPGAVDISIEEEISRAIPAIEAIVKNFPKTIISIDTFRSEVAKKAFEVGAQIINDISGGDLDQKMFGLVASLKIPFVMMHMKGTPQTMAQLSTYENLLLEIILSLQTKIQKLEAAGVKDIIVDPGFGFAKNIDQNFELLRNLERLQILEKPILAGLSRKSMIWKTLQTNPENALNGTIVLNSIALLKGASILRVHDVKEAKEVISLVSHLTQ